MPKTAKDLLEFWEEQMRLSHTSSNYFFRKKWKRNTTGCLERMGA